MVKKLTTIFLTSALIYTMVVPQPVHGATILGDFGTNLSAHWTFDESSDGSGAVPRYDSTANNNDLTDNNTVASAAGKIEYGADFEYSNTEYLSITDANQTGLDLDGDFSWSFWIKIETDNNTYSGIIAKDENGANNTRSYGLWYDNRNFANFPRFTLELYPNGYSYPNYWTGYIVHTLTPETWYHIVITCDISGADNSKVYLYSNGVGIGYFTKSDGNGATSIQDTAATTYIGKAPNVQALDGILDEFSVWKGRILDSTEVGTIYNSGAGIPYATGGGGTPAETEDFWFF